MHLRYIGAARLQSLIVFYISWPRSWLIASSKQLHTCSNTHTHTHTRAPHMKSLRVYLARFSAITRSGLNCKLTPCCHKVVFRRDSLVFLLSYWNRYGIKLYWANIYTANTPPLFFMFYSVLPGGISEMTPLLKMACHIKIQNKTWEEVNTGFAFQNKSVSSSRLQQTADRRNSATPNPNQTPGV